MKTKLLNTALAAVVLTFGANQVIHAQTTGKLVAQGNTHVSSGTYDGKLRLKSGAKYEIHYYMEANASQISPRLSPKSTANCPYTSDYSNIILSVKLDVVSVDVYGNYQIRLTYENGLMRFQTSTDRGLPNVDNKYESSRFEFGYSDGLKGGEFLIKISPDNKLIAVYGFDAMRAKMLKQIERLSPLEQRAAQSFVAQFLTENSVKSKFGQLTGVPPHHPIRVGETWDSTPEIPADATPAPLVRAERWLMGINNGVAGIKDNESFTLKGSPKANPEQPESVIDISGSRNAMTDVSIETGLVQNFRGSQNIEGTIAVKTGPQNTFPIEIMESRFWIVRMRERKAN